MDEIVVVGGGGHARVVLSLLHKLGTFRIIGYTDCEDRGKLSGVQHLGGDDVLKALKEEHPRCAAVLGLGQITSKDIENRTRIRRKLEEWGYGFPAVSSPDAVVNRGVEIGEGTVIFDGAVINSGARIGKDSIINTNTTVEHDCLLGESVHVASGAVLSGGVRVGSRTFIGAGAVIIHGVTVGEDCFIGAGAVVAEDCLQSGTYIGVPARKKPS